MQSTMPGSPAITHKSGVEDVAQWLASLRCSSAVASQKYADAVRRNGISGQALLCTDPDETAANLSVSTEE